MDNVSGRPSGQPALVSDQAAARLAPSGFDQAHGADLFGDAAPAPKRKLDLRTEFLKERYGLHPEWVWHSFQVIDTDQRPSQFAWFEGGVYPFAISRGKHKGRTNYRKPLPDTERKVVLSEVEYAAWLPTWEARTGKCHVCKGSGQKWLGWNHQTGNRYEQCPRCGATGVAPASVDTLPEGRDAQQGSVRSKGSAVPAGEQADAQGGPA